MPLLLDADALIKLHGAGILDHVARTFECIIPEGIFIEVVTRGRQFHHPDAAAIGEIIETHIEVHSPSPVTDDILALPGVDSGERELLCLLNALPPDTDAMVISDDRRFLAALYQREIPALTPPDLLGLITRQGFLHRREARFALERMRPHIRETAYRQALTETEGE
jgi:hypothetical protein